MVSKVLFSSDKTEWETPQWLFDLLDSEYHFTLDACATPENAKCEKFFTEQENGLERQWKGSVWVNPPYGREIGQWVEKAASESKFKRVDRVVMLLPARTDTKWWHAHVMHNASEIRFIEGRLRFVGSAGAAPFPSVIVVFDDRPYFRYVGKSINARGR